MIHCDFAIFKLDATPEALLPVYSSDALSHALGDRRIILFIKPEVFPEWHLQDVTAIVLAPPIWHPTPTKVTPRTSLWLYSVLNIFFKLFYYRGRKT